MEGEIGNQKYFSKCFNFSQAWRPYGISKRNYGGQLTREEMDVVTDQVMLAVAGYVPPAKYGYILL